MAMHQYWKICYMTDLSPQHWHRNTPYKTFLEKCNKFYLLLCSYLLGKQRKPDKLSALKTADSKAIFLFQYNTVLWEQVKRALSYLQVKSPLSWSHPDSIHSPHRTVLTEFFYLNASLREAKPLLHNSRQLPDAASLFTQHILGSGKNKQQYDWGSVTTSEPATTPRSFQTECLTSLRRVISRGCNTAVLLKITSASPSQIPHPNNVYQTSTTPLKDLHSVLKWKPVSWLPGGKYDNLSPGWSDPDFYSRVPIFSQFTSQKLIQFSFEDAISDKLWKKQTKTV